MLLIQYLFDLKYSLKEGCFFKFYFNFFQYIPYNYQHLNIWAPHNHSSFNSLPIINEVTIECQIHEDSPDWATYEPCSQSMASNPPSFFFPIIWQSQVMPLDLNCYVDPTYHNTAAHCSCCKLEKLNGYSGGGIWIIVLYTCATRETQKKKLRLNENHF